MGIKLPRRNFFIFSFIHLFNFDLQVIGCFFPFLDASDEGMEVVLVVDVGEQNAACGVLGDDAGMDSDAFSFGDVTYLRHVFAELGRPCHLEWVRAFGDEEVGVLEGL